MGKNELRGLLVVCEPCFISVSVLRPNVALVKHRGIIFEGVPVEKTKCRKKYSNTMDYGLSDCVLSLISAYFFS